MVYQNREQTLALVFIYVVTVFLRVMLSMPWQETLESWHFEAEKIDLFASNILV